MLDTPKEHSTERKGPSVSSVRDRRARRAKKSLAWGLILLVFGQCLVSWVVDHPFRKYRFAEEIRSSIDDFEPFAKNHDYIVLMGSSRTGSAFRPDELAPLWAKATNGSGMPILNLSTAAGTPLTIEATCERLHASNFTAPKLAVIEV